MEFVLFIFTAFSFSQLAFSKKVDPDLDCAVKKFALEYANIIQPGVNLQVISDAFQMNNCSGNSSRAYSKSFKLPPSSIKTPPFVSEGVNVTITIYVDPKIGDDNNEGTLYKPMKTIQAALTLYRKKKVQASDGGVIYLKKGTYYLTEPVVIHPEDSNLMIMGQRRDEVLVSGGKNYTLNWRPYKSLMDEASKDTIIKSSPGAKYYGHVSISEECKQACREDSMCRSFTWYDHTYPGNFSYRCYFHRDDLWEPKYQTGCTSGKKMDILMADLSDQKPVPFTSFFIDGRRAVRARYPNGNPEITGLHTNPTGYTNAVSWLPPIKTPPAADVRIDDPKRGGSLFSQFGIGVGGPADVFHPPESYWARSSPTAGSTYRVPSGLRYNPDEEFVSRNWSDPKTGVVHAFHCGHWGNWQFSVDNRDMTNQTVTWSYGGFQEARGCDKGAEYYIENIKEELDSPGEWFYDEVEMVLYFIPNGTSPSTGIGTFLERLFIVEGSIDDPVYNISITNVTFAYTEPTFLKEYEVPSGGDWSIHRGGGVFAEGVDGFTIKNCLFDSMGGNGLLLSNYIRRAVVDGNEFKFTGDTAIALIGSTNMMDGTSGNQPRGTLITNNFIYHFGIFGKQTAAFFQALSAQTTFARNIFFGGPRAGININDGFGGGNFISNNLGFDVVKETEDHGVFNSWDRQPYLTKVGDGVTPSLTPAFSLITMNFFISNFNSIWPIDHDDGSCYYKDTDNFLVYGGYKNYLGHSHIVQNNVYVVYPADALTKTAEDVGFAYVPYCIDTNGAASGSSGWGEEWTSNVCIIGQSRIYQLEVCGDPWSMSELVPFTANNVFYTPNPSQVDIKCGNTNYTLEGYQKLGYDLGSEIREMLDNDGIIKLGRSVLNL